MKKIILILVVVMISCIGYVRAEGAGRREQGFPSIYQPRTLNAISYTAIGSTRGIFASSMTFTINGTTYSYIYANAVTNTVGKIVNLLNAITGVTCTLVDGTYSGNDSAELSTVALGYTTTAEIWTVDNTLGMQYTIAAGTKGRSIFIAEASMRATFATGDCFITVYDAATVSTNSIIRSEKIGTSALDAPMDLNRWFYGTPETAMTFVVLSSTWITGATVNKKDCMNITGFKK